MWPPWLPSGRLPQQGGHAGCLRHPADRPYRKTGRSVWRQAPRRPGI